VVYGMPDGKVAEIQIRRALGFGERPDEHP
jgi:hypothetical protein